MISPTGLSKMKVQAHKVDVLELSTDTLTSDIERFFSAQGVDITRNTFGELLFVEMDGVVYHTGKAYAKSPDGSIKEYTDYSYSDFSDTSSALNCEEFLQREIPVEGCALKLTHADKGGYLVTGFDTGSNPANVFYNMSVGSVEELNILFHSGPVVNGRWNGVTNEVLLTIVLDRLQRLQSGKYPCVQNEEAIKGIQHAIDSLLDRTSPVSSNSVVTDREDSIYRLKSILEGWSGRFTNKLNALELLLAENNIQIGGLVEGRKSLIFKYINDPKGSWWTVNVDEICEPSRTKWQLTGDGYTTMVNHHPIFDHEIILKMVASQMDKLYFGGTS